jgi:hypothetical protein
MLDRTLAGTKGFFGPVVLVRRQERRTVALLVPDRSIRRSGISHCHVPCFLRDMLPHPLVRVRGSVLLHHCPREELFPTSYSCKVFGLVIVAAADRLGVCRSRATSVVLALIRL